MRKFLVLVFVLALLVPAGAVFADPGSSPSSETFEVTCEGLGTFDVVVTGSAGHTDFGIGIVRALWMNGELVFSNPGKGYTTIECSWSVDGNDFVADVQGAPPGGH
jgi:hypothetical protein